MGRQTASNEGLDNIGKSSINWSTILKVVRMVIGLFIGLYCLHLLKMNDSESQLVQMCTIRSEQEFNLGIWNASNAARLGEEASLSDAQSAWNRAIQHMHKVDSCSRFYKYAEEKIVEYEISLNKINAVIEN